MISPSLTADQVAACAQLACLLEVSAPKPGNVSFQRNFHDARYEDFLASAVALGPAMGAAETRNVGLTIRMAVEATRRWTRANTNLGLVLLFAPLARAAFVPGPHLAARLAAVLASTTREDAREVYATIRLAQPGGLGRVPDEDVAGEPTVTLFEAMALARDRDAIAREYVTGYATTFGLAVPALQRARRDGLTWSDAVVETYLTLLANEPDSLIVRKAGAAAQHVQARARAALLAGGVRDPAGRELLTRLDRELADPGNQLNPGTTADLTGAAIFAVLLEGGWCAGA